MGRNGLGVHIQVMEQGERGRQVRGRCVDAGRSERTQPVSLSSLPL